MIMNPEPSRAGATSERSSTGEKSSNLSRIRPVEQSIAKRANPETRVRTIISLVIVGAFGFLAIFLGITLFTNQALFETAKNLMLFVSLPVGVVLGYYLAIEEKNEQLRLAERRATESEQRLLDDLQSQIKEAKEQVAIAEARLSTGTLQRSVISSDIMSDREGEEIQVGSGGSLDKESLETAASISTLHISILEEPLTPQNLALTLEALTELTTKFWLIAKRRLSDLIEYTQTHDVRFAYEAGTTIASITYNSPLNFGLNVDKVAPGVAEAVMTVVDGLTQRKAHLEQLELANEAAEQKNRDDAQKSELDRTKEELAIQRERVALLRETMEAQKQGIEYALEIAGKMVDVMYPNADAETKGMIIRTLLPTILQLDNVKGLQLPLPEPQNKQEGIAKEE